MSVSEDNTIKVTIETIRKLKTHIQGYCDFPLYKEYERLGFIITITGGTVTALEISEGSHLDKIVIQMTDEQVKSLCPEIDEFKEKAAKYDEMMKIIKEGVK